MSLKRISLFTALFALVLGLFAADIHAQTSRLYLAGYLGLTVTKDLTFSEGTTGTAGDIELKNGASFAGALGIRFSRQLRMEGEFSYRKTDMDRMEFDNGNGFELGGELQSYLTLLNVYYDFDVNWKKLQPFVGAGIGFGWHDGEIDDVSGIAVDASDDTAAFAWQVGGGLKYRIDPNLAFTGAYRYVGSSDLEFENYEIEYGGHEFRIGLEYDFPVK